MNTTTGQQSVFSKKVYLQLFAILWLHATLLDLVYVQKDQVTIFWQQTATITTTFIHVLTAAVPTLVIFVLIKSATMLNKKL